MISEKMLFYCTVEHRLANCLHENYTEQVRTSTVKIWSSGGQIHCTEEVHCIQAPLYRTSTYPTNKALLMNFRLSSNAEILLISTN